jgi:hypothetical protein
MRQLLFLKMGSSKEKTERGCVSSVALAKEDVRDQPQQRV